MKTWQKIVVPVLICLVICGAYLLYVWKSRQDPGVIGKKSGETEQRYTADELVTMKEHYFPSFNDARDLEGKNVWMKSGYSLAYYPYVGGQVQFAKRVGLLPSAEKLAIQKLVKASAPAKEDNRVPHGSKQYFAVFSLAGNADEKPGLFAAPIGYVEGNDEKLFCDQLFYYDDPRVIYAHWPKPVWDAIATHTPTVGMNELQTRMAVGVMQQSDSSTEGDRTVTYVTGDKNWTVTFVKNKATAVKAGS
jgi:hypothetical protein